MCEWSAMVSVLVLTFQHPKCIKGAFFPFTVIVFQHLLGAVLSHFQCWNTHTSAGSVVVKDDFVVTALHELSVRLCRGNCVLYKQSLDVLARMSGDAFRGVRISARLDSCEQDRNDCTKFWCSLRDVLTGFRMWDFCFLKIARFYILYAVTHTHTHCWSNQTTCITHKHNGTYGPVAVHIIEYNCTSTMTQVYLKILHSCTSTHTHLLEGCQTLLHALVLSTFTFQLLASFCALNT